MKTLLEVKEYDVITGNPDYKDDSNYKYLAEPSFTNLINFIQEYTSNDDSEDILNSLKVGFKRGPGKVITAQGYVGLIQMKDGTQVQILPKISFDSKTDETSKTKKIFIKMLRCMDDFDGKVFGSANLNVDRMNLYEIFIAMYLSNVTALAKKGLKSTYIEESNNLFTIKGKINIQKQIRANVVHKERIFCEYDEYQINRPENKIIKATLNKLETITERDENKKSIKQLLSYFEYVDQSLNYDADFSKVAIDRSMKDYVQILEWSKIFLKNKSFTTFSGKTTSRALLFPMDKLFEAYVAKLVKKHSETYHYSVSAQDKGHYLFDTPTSQFALRPDIVVSKSDGTLVILDTKWKKLTNNIRINYGISQADMYQMYAYAKKYAQGNNVPNVWLLYPVNEEMKSCNNIHFASDDGVNVYLYFVDLDNADNSVDNLLKSI